MSNPTELKRRTSPTVGRWTGIVLTTSLCLLLLGGAQRVPWVAVKLQELQGVGGLRPARSTGTASLPPAGGNQTRPAAPGPASPAWPATEAAVTQLQERLKRWPDDGAAYGQLAGLYLQKTRETGDPRYYPKAEAALQRALALAPDDALAVVLTGSLQLARHDFGAALDWGERARALAPQSPAVYGVIADAALELGRYEQAVDAIQTMVDLRPDLASYSRVSYARELYGDLPGAIEAMQRAVNAGAPRAEGTSWARIQLAHLYFLTGDIDAAERQYGLALRVVPGYAPALAGLGRVAAARGDLRQAITRYTQALDAAPLPEYAMDLGDLYRAVGDERAAAKQDDLVRVIAQLQRDSGMDVDLELARFEADRATDAAAVATALERARTAYARRPGIHAADALAWALYRTERPAEALPYAREALRLGTQDPLLLFHAGAIAAAAGEADEARRYLDAALARNDRFHLRFAPEARRLLEQLGREAK